MIVSDDDSTLFFPSPSSVCIRQTNLRVLPDPVWIIHNLWSCC